LGFPTEKPPTENLLNKHWLYTSGRTTSKFRHGLDVGPIPFALLGLVIGREAVPFLRRSKHPSDLDVAKFLEIGSIIQLFFRDKTPVN
jgi:hypothetical protein